MNEKIMTIERVLPQRSFSYNDTRTGQPQQVAVQPLLLKGMGDTLHAEATGELAQAFQREGLAEGCVLSLNLGFTAREWKTQQGEPRWENRCMVLGWTLLKRPQAQPQVF